MKACWAPMVGQSIFDPMFAVTLARRWFLAAAALFGGVLLLGWLVRRGDLLGFDLAISYALNLERGRSSDILIVLMQAISWVGGGVQRYGIVALLAAVLWRWWGWRAGLAMGLAALVSSGVSSLLKMSFARVRPDLVAQLDPIHSPAFPSGHATNAAVVYILFIMLLPQARHQVWQWLAGGMILLTGLSRVMLGVHWPSDVVGGWMLGAAFALLTATLLSLSTDKSRQSGSLVEKNK
jgi:undecaprenyl-diphosphatase